MEKQLNTDKVTDLDDKGNIDVEWYPIPEWLQEAIEEIDIEEK